MPQNFIGSALAVSELVPSRIWGKQESWGGDVGPAEHFTNTARLKEGLEVFEGAQLHLGHPQATSDDLGF